MGPGRDTPAREEERGPRERAGGHASLGGLPREGLEPSPGADDTVVAGATGTSPRLEGDESMAVKVTHYLWGRQPQMSQFFYTHLKNH